MALSGTKDEHFSCFYSSCQWGLRQTWLARQYELFENPVYWFVLTQSEKLSNTNIVHAGPWLLRVGEHPPGSAISSFSRRSIAKVLGQNICRIAGSKRIYRQTRHLNPFEQKHIFRHFNFFLFFLPHRGQFLCLFSLLRRVLNIVEFYWWKN